MFLDNNFISLFIVVVIYFIDVSMSLHNLSLLLLGKGGYNNNKMNFFTLIVS